VIRLASVRCFWVKLLVTYSCRDDYNTVHTCIQLRIEEVRLVHAHPLNSPTSKDCVASTTV
jgi:hypothetical protein